jgi:hypothetical protein
MTRKASATQRRVLETITASTLEGQPQLLVVVTSAMGKSMLPVPPPTSTLT